MDIELILRPLKLIKTKGGLRHNGHFLPGLLHHGLSCSNRECIPPGFLRLEADLYLV